MNGLHGAVDHLVASIAAIQTASIDELSYEQIVAELDRIKAATWAVTSVEHRLTVRLMDADPHALGVYGLDCDGNGTGGEQMLAPCRAEER